VSASNEFVLYSIWAASTRHQFDSWQTVCPYPSPSTQLAHLFIFAGSNLNITHVYSSAPFACTVTTHSKPLHLHQLTHYIHQSETISAHTPLPFLSRSRPHSKKRKTFCTQTIRQATPLLHLVATPRPPQLSLIETTLHALIRPNLALLCLDRHTCFPRSLYRPCNRLPPYSSSSF
jgi:hypothetical protein